jgi:hypothetical protein
VRDEGLGEEVLSVHSHIRVRRELGVSLWDIVFTRKRRREW